MTDMIKRPLIMGILNITPDSFSGDGILKEKDYILHALSQGEHMVREGADILDVGGESSRPGSAPITANEELRRIIPVIHALKEKLKGVPIAIDTTKAEVADRALHAGAEIINDISALAHDPEMAAVAAKHNVKIVLMHNRSKASAISHEGSIGHHYDAPFYKNVVQDVIKDLDVCIKVAIHAGIEKRNIILDPGIGFGKTPPQNLALIAHLQQIKSLGFPLLMGVSRKSFIGLTLDLPVEERLEGTAACVAACVLNGADILRVHDVKPMARIVKMATALRDA